MFDMPSCRRPVWPGNSAAQAGKQTGWGTRSGLPFVERQHWGGACKRLEAPQPAALFPEAPQPVALFPEAPQPVALFPEAPQPATLFLEAPQPAALPAAQLTQPPPGTLSAPSSVRVQQQQQPSPGLAATAPLPVAAASAAGLTAAGPSAPAVKHLTGTLDRMGAAARLCCSLVVVAAAEAAGLRGTSAPAADQQHMTLCTENHEHVSCAMRVLADGMHLLNACKKSGNGPHLSPTSVSMAHTTTAGLPDAAAAAWYRQTDSNSPGRSPTKIHCPLRSAACMVPTMQDSSA